MIGTLTDDKTKQATIISNLSQEKNKLLAEKKENKEKIDALEKKLEQFKEVEDFIKPISVIYKEGGFIQLQSLLKGLPQEDHDKLVELGSKLDVLPLLQSKQIFSITTDLINSFKQDVITSISKQVDTLQETLAQIQKTLDTLQESLKSINLPATEKSKMTSSLESQVSKLEGEIKRWKGHKEKFSIESATETSSSTVKT